MLHVLTDRGFFRGSYTKFMACVNIPFVLPCLEANCKAAATKSKHTKHWYVVDVFISFLRPPIAMGRPLYFAAVVTIFFLLLFFLACFQQSEIGCLPYFHT